MLLVCKKIFQLRFIFNDKAPDRVETVDAGAKPETPVPQAERQKVIDAWMKGQVPPISPATREVHKNITQELQRAAEVVSRKCDEQGDVAKVVLRLAQGKFQKMKEGLAMTVSEDDPEFQKAFAELRGTATISVVAGKIYIDNVEYKTDFGSALFSTVNFGQGTGVAVAAFEHQDLFPRMIPGGTNFYDSFDADGKLRVGEKAEDPSGLTLRAAQTGAVSVDAKTAGTHLTATVTRDGASVEAQQKIGKSVETGFSLDKDSQGFTVKYETPNGEMVYMSINVGSEAKQTGKITATKKLPNGITLSIDGQIQADGKWQFNTSVSIPDQSILKGLNASFSLQSEGGPELKIGGRF